MSFNIFMHGHHTIGGKRKRKLTGLEAAYVTPAHISVTIFGHIHTITLPSKMI